MDHRIQPSAAATLGGARPAGHDLGHLIPALRGIKRRKDLSASPLYQEHGEAILAITQLLAWDALPAPEGPARGASGKFLRVAAWNIERGREVEGIKNYLAAHPLLSQADVILLNEVDAGMARSGNTNVAALVAGALGMGWVFGNSYFCLSRGNPRDGAPDEENRLGLHGNAILSRHPILRAENFGVAVTKDKFESSEKRLGHKKALWAEIATPLGKLPIATVHLDSGANASQRAAQMQGALAKLEERGLTGPCLVGGDWNTTTYSLRTIRGLLWNVFVKLLRGGFPHALHHYVHPDLIYERAVFDAVLAAGFDYESFNQKGVGTTRYEVGAYDSESKVRDYLPEIAVKALRWKLKPWNGVAALKLDWFAGRGVRALTEGEVAEESGRTSLSPQSFEKPKWQGRTLSDHDPIVVDVMF